MFVKCIDSGDTYGTGKDLLSLNKVYPVIQEYGGYYVIQCDDGNVYAKTKARFKRVVVKS